MRLSAEMYDLIVSGLKSDTQGDKDKRREPRVGMAGEADFVTVTDKGQRIAGVAKVRDISRSGVGLLFTKQVSGGQRFVVQLESSNGEPIWLICTTAYCRQVEEAQFSIGARIMQLLRAEQIQLVEAKSAARLKIQPRRVSPEDEANIARISRAILG